MKTHLIQHLTPLRWKDLGPYSNDSVDYPDFADQLCVQLREPGARGVLICGSGQGMAIRANRYRYVRAALCWTAEVAQLAREHNDANVLCLPARLISLEMAESIVQRFLNTPFSGGRHQRRVDKLSLKTEG